MLLLMKSNTDKYKPKFNGPFFFTPTVSEAFMFGSRCADVNLALAYLWGLTCRTKRVI